MSTKIALFNITPSVWLYQITSANDKDKQKSRTTKSFTHIFFELNQNYLL